MQTTEEAPASSVSFRPEDPRLFKALDVYAKRMHRSRNMVMYLLLLEAMQREGLWPPPPDDPE